MPTARAGDAADEHPSPAPKPCVVRVPIRATGSDDRGAVEDQPSPTAASSQSGLRFGDVNGLPSEQLHTKDVDARGLRAVTDIGCAGQFDGDVEATTGVVARIVAVGAEEH
jgi:hypothetical protein